MNIMRRIIFTISLVVLPSTALAQSTEEAKRWCEKTLWAPVDIPPADKALGQTTMATKKSSNKTVYTLSLSGGGYRAMLFHVGALHRLNDERLLSKLNIVSSVSGGSITASVLAHRWELLNFKEDGYVTNLKEVIEQPLRELADHTTSVPSVLVGLLPFTSAPERLSRKLDELLFNTDSSRRARLADIGSGQTGKQKYSRPVFIFLATNLQTGELWQFRSNVIGGPQTGWTESGNVSLADAVVASAGFPPFFAPIKLDLPSHSHNWTPCAENKDNPFGADPRHEPTRAIPDNKEEQDSYRREVYLADGGILDNLGVSSIEEINRVRRLRLNKIEVSTVNLISDGGAATPLSPQPSTNWIGVFRRVTGLMSDQPNDLRIGNIVRGASQRTLAANNGKDFTENHCERDKSKEGADADSRHPPLNAGLDSGNSNPYPNNLSAVERRREFGETGGHSTIGMMSDEGRNQIDSYAYWSIRRLPKIHYSMSCPIRSTVNAPWMKEEVVALASLKTDLAKLEIPLQTRLIDWGYLSTHHGLPYIEELYTPTILFIARCKIPSSLAPNRPVFPESSQDVACVSHQPRRKN